MDDRHEAARLLHQTITTVLAKHPDLAGEACAAINAGVSAAVDRINGERSKAQLGMVAALALLPPNRISDSTRDMLASVVTNAINPDNMCPAEREFMEKRNG